MPDLPLLQDPQLLRKPAVGRLLLIALCAEIAYAVVNISTMPVYLQFDRDFGASVIGLVVACFLLSEAVFKGPMGALADRFGRKWLIVAGPSISIATTVATFLVPRNWGYSETMALMVLRGLDGLGAAMLWPAAFALVCDSVEDDRRQHAMSLLNMCYLVGIALALPLGGMANDWLGPAFAPFAGSRSPALFLGGILFVAAAVLAFTQIPAAAPAHGSSEDGHGHVSIWAILGSLRSIPGYLLLAIVTFAGVGFPMAIVKLFSEEQLRLSESQFGMMALPAAILMASLSVPMSRLGERMGRARAVQVGLAFCSIGMGAIALGGVVPFLRSAWLVGIGVAPVGLGFLLALPAWMAAVSDLDPKRRAVNLGAVMTAQGIGAIVGMPIGSFLYERMQPVGVGLGYGEAFGRYAPFMGCALCIAAGWALSLRLLRPAPVIREVAPEADPAPAPEMPPALGADPAESLGAASLEPAPEPDTEP